ncbi:5598_t:CDS:2 [Entrophospora sp. SA101]|nr:5598_t:CDS:2 [Entrophospora sp. SA101]
MPLSLFFAIGTTTIITLGVSFSLLYAYQTELLYPAKCQEKSREFVVPNFGEQIPFTETILTTNDKIRIRAYICKQPITTINEEVEEVMVEKITVLALHGNRINIVELFIYITQTLILIVEKLYKEFKCNVVLLSYRGYGKSDGKPTEDGIKIDAQTALDYIKKHYILKNTKVVLYGRSLGKQDKLVPQSQMKSLYDLTNTKLGKCWKEFPGGKHSDMVSQSGYFETIGEFLKSHVELQHQYSGNNIKNNKNL